MDGSWLMSRAAAAPAWGVAADVAAKLGKPSPSSSVPKNDVSTSSGPVTSGLLRISGVASRLPFWSNRKVSGPPREVYDSGVVGVAQFTAPTATAFLAAGWPNVVGAPSPVAIGSSAKLI